MDKVDTDFLFLPRRLFLSDEIGKVLLVNASETGLDILEINPLDGNITFIANMHVILTTEILNQVIKDKVIILFFF